MAKEELNIFNMGPDPEGWTTFVLAGPDGPVTFAYSDHLAARLQETCDGDVEEALTNLLVHLYEQGKDIEGFEVE